MSFSAAIEGLIRQGVVIPDPGQVWIEETVNVSRLAAPGAVLFPGCRIRGARTFIAAGARLGEAGPVTVCDSFIGPGAAVQGGSCNGAVLLAGASLGPAAHVRGGTILEEQAGTAHAVGLKHTILFPFVTLGSLINFCDVLMAGGTGRDNHGEVGSSYIHFNFTPHQDKATASLLGDVPAGVMLDQPPIFLGGQGGLVGPCRLNFGTVAAAGTIVRKDELRPDRLIAGGAARPLNLPRRPGAPRALPRIMANNLIFIGNLFALRGWYREVRRRFIGPDFPAALHQGAAANIEAAIGERIHRLDQLCGRQGGQGAAAADLLAAFREGAVEIAPAPEVFLDRLEQVRQACGNHYLDAIRSLDPGARSLGTAWLQGIVDAVTARASAALGLPHIQKLD
jgi:bifunctional UDP-N-acetylglucosamine pyrophosphorylase / glucosamine-1-phosphate N-acetyltransferase